MFKLNIHSIVDVITNSSTVIYTYQNDVKEAEELLQEILDLMCRGEKVEDIFTIGVFASNNYTYTDYLDGEEECPIDCPIDDWKLQDNYIDALKENILNGKIDKPEWMKNIENEEGYNGYTPESSLHILAKDKRYDSLIKKVLSFLNSPSHEAFRDG